MYLITQPQKKLYDIKTPKMLEETMMRLANKKTYSEEPYFMSSGQRGIPEERKPFYENLADDPKILVTLETCSICLRTNLSSNIETFVL